MGQQSSSNAGTKTASLRELEERFTIETDIPETSCVILREKSTSEVFAMK
jgi:hypothetical protein